RRQLSFSEMTQGLITSNSKYPGRNLGPASKSRRVFPDDMHNVVEDLFSCLTALEHPKEIRQQPVLIRPIEAFERHAVSACDQVNPVFVGVVRACLCLDH